MKPSLGLVVGSVFLMPALAGALGWKKVFIEGVMGGMVWGFRGDILWGSQMGGLFAGGDWDTAWL